MKRVDSSFSSLGLDISLKTTDSNAALLATFGRRIFLLLTYKVVGDKLLLSLGNSLTAQVPDLIYPSKKLDVLSEFLTSASVSNLKSSPGYKVENY